MRLFLCSIFCLYAIHAQTCPPVNFVQGAQTTVFDKSTAGGLQRQPDGSFTRQRYSALSPYRKSDSTPNFQSTLFNCSPAANRAFKPPAGSAPLADRPTASSQPMLFSDFLGNGTIVGLAVVPGGFRIGPTVDSLLIVIFNSDGTTKSNAYYPVPTKPVGLLVADVNRDGKKDVVVVSQGSGSDQGSIAVLLGQGDGTVGSAVKYSAHGAPVSIVAFDFNGDRNLDIAAANSSTGDVSILLGRGDGTFSTATNVSTTGSAASSIALGDFNGDGKQDLVVGMNKALAMLSGNGDGTFRAASTISLAVSPSFLAPGDFNKDGKLDLAMSASLGGSVSVLLGDGAGKFSAQNDYAAGYEPTGIFAVDLDGDGNLDVAVATGHPDVLIPSPYATDVLAFLGRGDGTLMGAPTFATGSTLSAVVTADFNGDGKPDIAAAATDLYIMLTAGGGNFRTPVRIALPVAGNNGATPSSMAAGDFNGDGKQDLVIGYGYSDALYVLLGNGDGSFRAPLLYKAGGVVNSVAVADFDRDGKPDIVFCGAGIAPTLSPVAGVMLGNGDGTFKAVKPLSSFGNGPYSLTVGDFNRDGKPDLAIANKGTPGNSADPATMLVFLGQGDGTFQAPASQSAGSIPTYITAADVNGDGALDLLLATRGTDFVYQVAVYLGNGNGTFRAPSAQRTTYGPNWIAVTDLDGDGKPDLAIAHCCGDTDTTFKLGNGDGTFGDDIHLSSSISPVSLVAGDLNGDGKPDLVIGQGNLPSSSVSVFLTFAAAAPALSNVNGASFLTGSLAPDSFATAVGTNLSTATQTGTAPFPSTLGGTSVTIKDSSGAQLSAPLQYVSPAQINYIIPAQTALGPATVTIASGGTTTATGAVTIAAVGPGIFLFGGTNLVAANVIRARADGSQSVEDVFAVSGNNIVPAPIDVSQSSDQVYLVIYATGLRGHSSAANSVTVTVGGAAQSVAYAGSQPQFPGVDQVNVLLPQSLSGKGDVTIQVTVDGQTANTGHITIK